MNSESFGHWKIYFAFQRCGRRAEHVSSEAYQQKQIIGKMTGKMSGKSNEGKRKSSGQNTHNNGGRSSGRHYNNRHGGRRRGRGGHIRRGNNRDHLKTIECYNCGKKGHYSTNCTVPKKNGNENSNMVSKSDFKNLFQSSLKYILTKKETQRKRKEETDLDDESLHMNVFEKLMEGKHNEIASKNDHDPMSIENTNSLFHFEQDNSPDDNYLDNKNKDANDEIA
jgi:hypothetical protein